MYRFVFSPGWLGRLAVAVALAVVMSLLGAWQLSRYEERAAINARIDAAEPADPTALAGVLSPPGPGRELGPAPPEQASWTMVRAAGRYDPANEILVRGRTVAGQVGYEVVTPLLLPDGSAILVDRGWVPPAPTGAADRPEVPPPPAGEVTVVGRLRPSEGGARAVRRDGQSWETRRIDLPALAPHLPYPLYRAYLLVDTPADPALTPVPVRRENAWLNAGYAAQWWIFAGLVLGGYGWLVHREARRRTGPGERGGGRVGDAIPSRS